MKQSDYLPLQIPAQQMSLLETVNYQQVKHSEH